MKVVIVDYQLGNLFSVASALRHLGHEPIIDFDGGQIREGCLVILPGVASFGEGVRNLQASGQFLALLERAQLQKPIIGLCLGAQLLFESSDESPEEGGLSLLQGRVKRLRKEHYRVPHQGWSRIHATDSCPKGLRTHPSSSKWFYFSHSFRIEPLDLNTTWMEAKSSAEPISAVVGKGNVVGIQFHPERSGQHGVSFLGQVIDSVQTGF